MLGNIIFDSSLIQVLPSVVHYLVWNLFKGIWIISMLGKVCLCLQADTCDHLLCYSVNFSPCFFNVIRSILMSNQSLKYFKIQDVTTWSGEKKNEFKPIGFIEILIKIFIWILIGIEVNRQTGVICIFISSIHIAVGYPRWIPSQRGPSFIQQRKKTEKIHIYPDFHKSKWWGRIFTRIALSSKVNDQFIEYHVTTCLTLTCNPNLFRIRSGTVNVQ